jgi:hypothetical protein
MNYRDIESCFSMAFNRTVLMLFKPFSLKKWLMIGLIASFAAAISGGGGGGGGGNINIPDGSQHSSCVHASSEDAACPHHSDNSSDTKTSLEQTNQSNQSNSQPEGFGELANVPGFVWTILGVFFVITILLTLLFTWLNSRFVFIFINSVIHNTTEIKKPWEEYRSQGNSYFKWLVSILVILFVVFVAVLGSAFFSFASLDGILPSSSFNWTLFISSVVIGVIVWIVVLFVGHMVVSFALPIMAKQKVGILVALSKLLSLIKTNFLAFLIYLPIALVLGIVCGILVLVVFLLFLLLLLILGLFVFLVPALVLGMGTVYIVYAIIMGIIFMLLLVALTLIANVPVAVFYRAFTLAYLAKIDPELELYRDEDLTNLIGQETSEASEASKPPKLPETIQNSGESGESGDLNPKDS